MGADILEATGPTLVGLPTEVLVTVARFLDLKGGEMKRLVHAVGPQSAKAIQSAYLNANLAYLKYLHDLLAERSDRARCRAVAEGLRQWMEVNHRWRECLDIYGGGEGVRGVLYNAVITAREGKELPESMPWPHKVIQEESEDDDDDDDNGDGRLKLFEQVSSGHIAVTHLDNGLFQVKCSPCDFRSEKATSSIIVGIKTTAHIDLVKLPLNTLSFFATQEDDAKKVRLMNYYFAHFFLNASLAIDLELMEILQHLVEVIKLSPNSGSSVGVHPFPRCQPLFLSALVAEDSSAFKYLLSRPNFNLRPEVGRHALHNLRQLKSSRRGSMPLPSLSTLVRRIRTLVKRVERLDMDSFKSAGATTWKHTDGTPLYDILFSDSDLFVEENISYDDVDVALVNLYLSFGATTTHFSIEHIPDKTEHQRTVTKLLRAASQDERDAIMEEFESHQ